MLVKEAAALAAEKVREQHWDGSIPVDPVAIAEAMNIEVRFAAMVAGVSGAIVADKGARPVVLVEESENYGRQMFTCGHELGHFIERKERGDAEYSFVERRTNKYDLHELYADTFAANLLMPEKEFRNAWRRSESEYLVAAHFCVSPSAVLMRKKNLGL